MVDFKKMAQEIYDKKSPEEKAAYDLAKAKQMRREATNYPIMCRFNKIAATRNGTDLKVVKTWDKYITMQMRAHDGRRTLQFIGGATGHEAYELNDSFARQLEKVAASDDPFWAICAGSARYERATVDCRIMLAYLKRHAFDLFMKYPEIDAKVMEKEFGTRLHYEASLDQQAAAAYEAWLDEQQQANETIEHIPGRHFLFVKNEDGSEQIKAERFTKAESTLAPRARILRDGDGHALEIMSDFTGYFKVPLNDKIIAGITQRKVLKINPGKSGGNSEAVEVKSDDVLAYIHRHLPYLVKKPEPASGTSCAP